MNKALSLKDSLLHQRRKYMLKNDETKQLIRKKERLVKRFLADKTDDFLGSFSRVLDEYFHSLLAKSTVAHKMTVSGNPVSLIALGGYGRQEQCIHSDVDLLILFEKKVPPDADELVKELLYPLWDARLETGYAVRTIKECLNMAWTRFDILTTMLDARFICGGSHIYSILMDNFRKKLSRKHVQTSLTRLVEQGIKRHNDFGDSSYLLEPNIKSGHGGLRDYHSILWYARIKEDIRSKKDLERCGFLSNEEYEALENALNFIWNIRNRLHYISGRKCDQLHFEYQIEVAKLLGFKKRNGHQGVESFMGELHAKMDFLKQINMMITEDILLSKKAKQFSNIRKPTNYKGIILHSRRLEFDPPEIVSRQPALMLKILVESGRFQKPLSIEARRIAGEFAHLIDDEFRQNPSNIKLFEKILSTSFWEFNVIHVMLSIGLLEAYIPEFSSIVNKIQYNQYHLFPVDKHSIRCVQVINSFKKKKNNTNSFYTGVYKEVRNKKILLLAALLHDIGKGDPAMEHSKKGAEITRTILNRFGYQESEIKDACFLVEYHLFLAKTATRRDTNSEETSVFCASRIKKVSLLRMLYLLTVADSMATGPKAWNEWIEILLRALFIKTMGILKGGELATRKAAKTIENKKNEILSICSTKIPDNASLKSQLNKMTHRYLLYVPASDIIEHFQLYQNLNSNEFIWKITNDTTSEVRTITIISREIPGFYSKLAGVFFLNGLNIIASKAYLFNNNTALGIFKVMPPKDKIFENEKWEKASKELHKAIKDDTFLDRLQERLPKTIKCTSGQIPEENSININNKASNFFTIIEVFTYDFPGLLFAITNTLYRLGVDISVAMVATKIDQVVDVFYVKSFENTKIDDPHREKEIKNAILNTLPKIETPIITKSGS